jgi:iron complex transport system substrate-binding protein
MLISPRRLRRSLALLVVVLVAVGITACGDSDSEDSATETPAETTPADMNGAGAAAKRIVSLSPTATEMLFAIGAGDQVVAVDDQSNYPADAPRTKLSGFQPNIEAISGYDPDLVVISTDTGDLKAGLERLGITVVLHSAATNLDGTYAQIEELGQATGHADDADELVNRVRAQIKEAVASLPEGAKGKTYYHELDNTYFTVTSKTFIGSIYGLLGLRNIADVADKSGSGYPQLSAEYIVQANPDFIFLADTKCCGQSLQTVAARPGWGGIAAVRNQGVVELDDDVASRWGPRVVDFLELVAERLRKVEDKAAA